MTKIDIQELDMFLKLLVESKQALELKFIQAENAATSFSKEKKLTGVAWGSAKTHFTDGYGPLFETFDTTAQLLTDQFSTYQFNFFQEVTGGYVKLDTAELEDLEIRMQQLASYKAKWLQDMADQLAGIPGIGKFFDDFSLKSTTKQVLLLRKFQEFEFKHQNDFDEIAQTLYYLGIGLEAVGNKKNFQGDTKGFSSPNYANEEWFKHVTKFNKDNEDKVKQIKKDDAYIAAANAEMTAQIINAQINLNQMNDTMMNEMNRSYSPVYNSLSAKMWFISESGWTVEYGEHYGKIGNKKVLLPYVIYIDPNGYRYTTDGYGRITSVNGELLPGKGVRNTYAQKIVGGVDRLPMDDGGHLIGSQFNGSGQIDNLVAQHSGINRSGGNWYKLEQEWAAALKSGSAVKVKIISNYSGDNLRPTDFFVTYFIDDMKFTVEMPNSK